jgi:aspartate-semialdehyde dehydrogenase
MSSFPDRRHRIIIAGASSLLGAELKSLLEESRFAASDFYLLDEELAAGTITEAGGEPAIIQLVQEDSFAKGNLIFFTGSAAFTRANVGAARSSGAKIIDLSGALAGEANCPSWSTQMPERLGESFDLNATQYAIPSAAAIAASTFSLALTSLGLRSLFFVAFQSVSEANKPGVEELETQTSQLLSFQTVGKPVFDTQVAFAMLDRFGPRSTYQLSTDRERLRREVKSCIGEKAVLPSLQVLHAPMFYGTTFVACAEFADNQSSSGAANPSNPSLNGIQEACKRAGFNLKEGEELSNVSAAGENSIQLATPEQDTASPNRWWLWGAADNIRLPAANAVKLAGLLP